MTFEKQYKESLKLILKEGVLQDNRTSTKTFSLFDVKLKFCVKDFYPILFKLPWRKS